MNICIIGSGGREATIAWKLDQSKNKGNIFIVPGNGGTEKYGYNRNVDITDRAQFSTFLIENKIDMLIVGPEEPLVKGLADDLKNIDSLSDLQIIGPAKLGAALEGSKAFAKEFMEEFSIPTAGYKKFAADQQEDAIHYLHELKAPYVLKADGLAAGKGVLIINDIDVAADEIKQMLAGKFGSAGNTIVIEEFLDGIEFSVFVVTDGKDYKILPVAKDYKRRGEGDTGLNTGGMGAISPVSFVDDELMEKVEKKIIQPTIKGIQSRGMDYKGFIFFGLIRVEGEPYVIEYNCRMGDPETEVVIPRVKNDLLELLTSVHRGDLRNQRIEHLDETAATIMLVSDGYPGAYEKGKAISGLDSVEDSIVFHAGTKNNDGQIITNGGRVLAITSFGNNMQDALSKSRSSIKKIDFEGKQFRSDIGFDL